MLLLVAGQAQPSDACHNVWRRASAARWPCRHVDAKRGLVNTLRKDSSYQWSHVLAGRLARRRGRDEVKATATIYSAAKT